MRSLLISLFALFALSSIPGASGALPDHAMVVYMHNELQPEYNNLNYLTVPTGGGVYLNDTYRLGRNIADLAAQPYLSVVLLQEISQTTPCLVNPSIILPGTYPVFKAYLEGRGLACNFGANTQSYWSKYFRYDTCNDYNSWRQSGNVVCVNTTEFTNIVFFTITLSTGSTVSAVNGTFKGFRNMTFVSVHVDSDVAGTRRDEIEELHVLFPNAGANPVCMCGDHNTDLYSNNLQNIFEQSGHIDPMHVLAMMTQDPRLGYRSQPLTREWYNSHNHGRIDRCRCSSATFFPYFEYQSGPNFGYPNSTRTGVLDYGQWETLPELQGNDTNEPYRIQANLMTTGSDHYPVINTMIVV